MTVDQLILLTEMTNSFRSLRLCWSRPDLHENTTAQTAYMSLLPVLIEKTKWILQKTPRHQRHLMTIIYGHPNALHAMIISVNQELLWARKYRHHMYDRQGAGDFQRPWEDIVLPRTLNETIYVEWRHLEDVCDPRQEIADMLIDTLLQNEILHQVLIETKREPLGSIEEEVESNLAEENDDLSSCNRGIFMLDDMSWSSDEDAKDTCGAHPWPSSSRTVKDDMFEDNCAPDDLETLSGDIRNMDISHNTGRKNQYFVKYGDFYGSHNSDTSTANTSLPPGSVPRSLDGYMQFSNAPPRPLVVETDDEWSGYIDAYVDSPKSNIST